MSGAQLNKSCLPVSAHLAPFSRGVQEYSPFDILTELLNFQSTFSCPRLNYGYYPISFLSLFILKFKYVSIFKYLANHYLLRRYWEPGNVLVSKNTLMNGTDTNITCPHRVFLLFFIIAPHFVPFSDRYLHLKT